MGVVYQTRQIKLDRVVALKMILAGGHASLGSFTGFDRKSHYARLNVADDQTIFVPGRPP